MFIYVVLVLLLVTTTICSENESFSVLEKLKSGLKFAGKLFSADRATGVANLVSEAFESHGKRNVTDEEKQNNIFSGFLRVLGFDAKRISAITVNAIIFIAQLISSSISSQPLPKMDEGRKAKDGSLFEWVINNSAIADFLTNVNDEKLPEKVIEFIKEKSLDEDTGCVQLLICKCSPFIRQMQKSITERSNSSAKGYNALFAYVPTIEEVSDNGDSCEEKYPYCTFAL